MPEEILAAAVEIARGHRRMGYEEMATLPMLITEAGGRVSDLGGGDVLAGAGDVLASNGHLHDQLLDLVAGPAHRPPSASLTDAAGDPAAARHRDELPSGCGAPALPPCGEGLRRAGPWSVMEVMIPVVSPVRVLLLDLVL